MNCRSVSFLISSLGVCLCSSAKGVTEKTRMDSGAKNVTAAACGPALRSPRGCAAVHTAVHTGSSVGSGCGAFSCIDMSSSLCKARICVYTETNLSQAFIFFRSTKVILKLGSERKEGEEKGEEKERQEGTPTVVYRHCHTPLWEWLAQLEMRLLDLGAGFSV